MMNIVQHQVFGVKYGYGKLLAMTNSTSSSWRMPYTGFTGMEYTIFDNASNEVLKNDIVTNKATGITADLSASSGDVSVYVMIDDINGVSDWLLFYATCKLTYIDFSVFPNLKRFIIYNGANNNIEVVGSELLMLEKFFCYQTVQWKGLDFSNTTNLSVFYSVIDPSTYDISIDISNNNNLRIYKGSMDPLYFNASNHLLLESIEFLNDFTGAIPTNINTTNLPNLRSLIHNNTYRNYDFSAIDYTKLTTLKLCCNLFTNSSQLTDLKTIRLRNLKESSLDINSIPLLETLELEAPQLTTIDLTGMTYLKIFISGAGNLPEYGIPLLTEIDLKPCTGLEFFRLSYQNIHPDLVILIDNGLNAQITNFEKRWNSVTSDVKVDDPVAANNGDTPYLSTIWKEYLDYDSWNFI